jgi:hypothetical protein
MVADNKNIRHLFFKKNFFIKICLLKWALTAFHKQIQKNMPTEVGINCYFPCITMLYAELSELCFMQNLHNYALCRIIRIMLYAELSR